MLGLDVSTQMVTPLPPHPALSQRLNEVLALVSVGAPTRQIAHALDLDRHTVIEYVRRIARKLDVEATPGRDIRILIVRKATEDLLALTH